MLSPARESIVVERKEVFTRGAREMRAAGVDVGEALYRGFREGSRGVIDPTTMAMLRGY